MKESVQLWVLTGASGLLLTLVLILFKIAIARFDKLIGEVQKLNVTVTHQSSKIERADERQDEADRRLNTHSDRIRDLELFKAKHEQK